jgi:hypothetical protein
VGSGAVGAEAGAGVVDVVLARAVEAVVDVGPFVAAVGGLPVVEQVTVPNVVGPAVGICGEDPQAATSSITPAANAKMLVPRTDVASIAHFLSPIRCPARVRHLCGLR